MAQTVLSLTETHHGLAGSGCGKQEEALRDEDRKVGGQLSVPKPRVPIGAVIAETRAFHMMRLSALNAFVRAVQGHSMEAAKAARSGLEHKFVNC